MSDEGISIKLELNADQAVGAIGTLLGYINSGELMQDIGNEVAEYSRDRILSKKNTAPDGSRWPSLAESTLLRKKKLGVAGKGILVEGAKSGRSSLVDTIMAANATRDYVAVGSSMIYTLIHQFGGKAALLCRH